ncbi:hypothetical protein BIW11_00875, partial [Tropilaelaps mercedesae]
MFESEFTADEFVRAGMECLSLANNTEIGEKMKMSPNELLRTVSHAFGEQIVKPALKLESLKRLFRLALRIDITHAEGIDLKPPPSSIKGHYKVKVKHVNSGTRVSSSAKEQPIWNQSFIIGPVSVKDSVQLTVEWRPKTNRVMQLFYTRVAGPITVPVSTVFLEDHGLKPLRLPGEDSGVLFARIRLWREPKRAYVTHVIVMLTLLKEPVRLVNKLSWSGVWTEAEIGLIQAHALGLTEAAVLTAQLHVLSIASFKIAPNYVLVFETLSHLRRQSYNPFEDKVTDLCRRFNKTIAETLKNRKSLLKCTNDYDRMQLIGILGCCTLIEDFELAISKEQFKQSVVAEVSLYFNEWLEKLIPLKAEPRKFLAELHEMLIDFSRTYGTVNDIIYAAWGDHVNEFLSDPAKKFILSFRDLAVTSTVDESFDIYHVVIAFCRHFHVKLNIENCFAASTVLQWFDYLYENHKKWITRMVSTDDFIPIVEDAADMSVRFSLALNGISECYELLLHETVHIREQGQAQGDVKGLGIIEGSSINSTKMKLECKTREMVEGFLTRLAFTIRKLMQQVTSGSGPQDIETRAMGLSEFMDKLLGNLCKHLNQMVFLTVLETLFRCCVEVLGSIAGEYQTWSPWQARRDPKALIECARLIRGCFYSPGSNNALPEEKPGFCSTDLSLVSSNQPFMMSHVIKGGAMCIRLPMEVWQNQPADKDGWNKNHNSNRRGGSNATLAGYAWASDIMWRLPLTRPLTKPLAKHQKRKGPEAEEEKNVTRKAREMSERTYGQHQSYRNTAHNCLAERESSNVLALKLDTKKLVMLLLNCL